jgi:hypothetical protein
MTLDEAIYELYRRVIDNGGAVAVASGFGS